jgi:transcriptional regulator with XRE-family HTH domain
MNLSEIGVKIKTLRKEKKLTQKDLALSAGISRVTIGKIENGNLGNTSIRSLDIIVNSLGYELDIKLKSDFGLPNLDQLKDT